MTKELKYHILQYIPIRRLDKFLNGLLMFVLGFITCALLFFWRR